MAHPFLGFLVSAVRQPFWRDDVGGQRANFRKLVPYLTRLNLEGNLLILASFKGDVQHGQN